MAEIKLEDWSPMSPLVGPPLPKWMGIYWPWYTPEAAEFQLSDLVISPPEVSVGEKVTISVVATNYGTAAGTRKITCTVT